MMKRTMERTPGTVNIKKYQGEKYTNSENNEEHNGERNRNSQHDEEHNRNSQHDEEHLRPKSADGEDPCGVRTKPEHTQTHEYMYT